MSIADFASRLYIFHFDALEQAATAAVPQGEIDDIRAKILSSWGRDRV